METEIYNRLNTLKLPIIPLAPSSDAASYKGNAERPIILYRRKITNIARDLHHAIAYTEGEIEIIIWGTTFQQSSLISDQIHLLLDKANLNGFDMLETNRFANESDLTIVHLWFSFFHG